MNDAFGRIEKSLKEAIAFAEGTATPARVTRYELPPVDVKQVRQSLGMTRQQFAAAFGFGLSALRHWERGDRQPRGAARTILNLLAKEPKTVLRILKPTACQL